MFMKPFRFSSVSQRHLLVYRTESILIRPLVCARCEAILSMPSKGSLSVLLHHDGRKHQCFTPQTESMLTEAECYCGKLSMAVFLAKCCDNCQNNSLCRLRQNKQATNFQHCRHAAIDQRAFIHTTASKSFHGDSVAYASNNAHRRPSTTNGTYDHTRTNTRKPNREWLVGRLVGTEPKLLDNPTCFM